MALEGWNHTAAWDVEDDSTPPIFTEQLDAFTWEENDVDFITTMTKSFFIPPFDSEYSLHFTECNDEAVLFFSENGDEEHKVLCHVLRCSRIKLHFVATCHFKY